MKENGRITEKTFEQICRAICENYNSIGSREQDEENLLRIMHIEVSTYLGLIPTIRKAEDESMVETYKTNIMEKVLPLQSEPFDYLQILGNHINNTLDKLHQKD